MYIIHKKMMMKKICEGANKSGLYDHMKMLIEQGKSGSKVKFINDDGETVDAERMLKSMIEKFWGDLFCMNGDATHGSKKEILDGGVTLGCSAASSCQLGHHGVSAISSNLHDPGCC